MTFQWDKVKEFLALPEGQKFIVVGIVVASTLCGVISWQSVKLDAANNQVRQCSDEKLQMQQVNSDTIKVLLQRFEQEKTAIYLANIAKLERKEADLDDALFEAKRVIANQRKGSAKLQKITSKVNKLVKDAAQ